MRRIIGILVVSDGEVTNYLRAYGEEADLRAALESKEGQERLKSKTLAALRKSCQKPVEVKALWLEVDRAEKESSIFTLFLPESMREGPEVPVEDQIWIPS